MGGSWEGINRDLADIVHCIVHGGLGIWVDPVINSCVSIFMMYISNPVFFIILWVPHLSSHKIKSNYLPIFGTADQYHTTNIKLIESLVWMYRNQSCSEFHDSLCISVEILANEFSKKDCNFDVVLAESNLTGISLSIFLHILYKFFTAKIMSYCLLRIIFAQLASVFNFRLQYDGGTV